MNDKIEGLVAEGRALLASGRPRDAVFAFERVLLLAPDHDSARAGLVAAQAASAEADHATEERLAAADEVPVPRGWFALRRADGDADPAVPAGVPSGRSRALLGALCATLFVILGASVAGNWNGWMRRLALAPVPQDSAQSFAAPPGPRAEDQTIAAARRLLDDGDPARAVALLDSVHPQQPTYPLARQLRGQAERALRKPESRP